MLAILVRQQVAYALERGEIRIGPLPELAVHQQLNALQLGVKSDTRAKEVGVMLTMGKRRIWIVENFPTATADQQVCPSVVGHRFGIFASRHKKLSFGHIKLLTFP